MKNKDKKIIEEFEKLFQIDEWGVLQTRGKSVEGFILKALSTQRQQSFKDGKLNGYLEGCQEMKKRGEEQKKEIIRVIEKRKEELFNSPNFREDPDWGYATLVKLQTLIKKI